MEESEKKIPVKNLDRIAEQNGFSSFEEADEWRRTHSHVGQLKAKIFARWTGKFDVVFYGPIKPKVAEERKLVDEIKEGVEELKKERVHGLKAKERRAQDRKKKS